MQSRHALPAWFGVGYALERFVSSGKGYEQQLQQMMAQFPLFSDLIRNVELAMAKADLAACTLRWLPTTACERVWKMVTEEFERTRQVTLSVTGQGAEKQSVPLRSIRLRNPYVDPMSLVQVDLLRRKRAGEDTEASIRFRSDHQRNRSRITIRLVGDCGDQKVIQAILQPSGFDTSAARIA
jgi:phosphoenolpyruvate carboxylase